MATKQETQVGHSVPRLDEEGLSADEIQLRAQGHVGELPRQFSAFQTIAFSFQISNTWVSTSATSERIHPNLVCAPRLAMQVSHVARRAPGPNTDGVIQLLSSHHCSPDRDQQSSGPQLSHA